MCSLGLWLKAENRSNGPWPAFSFSSTIVTKGLRSHLSFEVFRLATKYDRNVI
jgi:hypothetical protein